MTKLQKSSIVGYRYKITNELTNDVSTGFFKVSREMVKEELIEFLHQYTNGCHLKEKGHINVEFFQAEF